MNELEYRGYCEPSMSCWLIIPLLLSWELAGLRSTRLRLEDGPKGLECENGILVMMNNEISGINTGSTGEGRVEKREDVEKRARGPSPVPEHSDIKIRVPLGYMKASHCFVYMHTVTESPTVSQFYITRLQADCPNMGAYISNSLRGCKPLACSSHLSGIQNRITVK
jgi:hypothetical protein